MKTKALVAGAVLAALLPGPAQAAAPDAEGVLCGFASTGHPTDAGVQVGEIDGGPLAVANVDDAFAQPVTATLTCAIHVGWGNLTHAGSDAVSASATGNAVVTLPPTVVSYKYDPYTFEVIAVCTELAVTDGHGDTYHLYYDGFREEFSSSPNVECQWAWGEPPPPPPPIWERVDAIVCPIFAVVFPPYGDIPDIWDCPPYGV